MTLTPEKILREVLKRRSNRPVLLDPEFHKQNAIIQDPCRLKAALCTRRAGKSYGMGLYMFQEAMANPGVSILYIALTRESARKIMFKDVLKQINSKYKLNVKFNEIQLTATLPNGAVLYLAGADAKPDEMEKFLGQKYKLVIIDESASYKQDLRKMVYGVLKPAMTDLRGTIVLIGTPGNVTRGLYFDITTGKEPGWSVHKWSALENPYIKNEIATEMDELVKANPLIVDTPLWKQMYLGEWYIDTDKLVYKFNDERNTTNLLPELKGKAEWQYVLGIDLGYEDPSAFVVCAYNEHDPNMYIVEAYKKSKMDITDVADKIKEIAGRYSINKFIVDNANKQAVEEIRKRHALPLTAAEKTGKIDFIEIMNSELISGKIKLVGCQDLVEEWLTLVWDEKSEKRVENSACPNHLSDAALYAWRYCYGYIAQQFVPPPSPHAEATIDEFWEKASGQVGKVQPFWEKDWA